jgi:hypothetical protein
VKYHKPLVSTTAACVVITLQLQIKVTQIPYYSLHCQYEHNDFPHVVKEYRSDEGKAPLSVNVGIGGEWLDSRSVRFTTDIHCTESFVCLTISLSVLAREMIYALVGN